MYIFHGFLSPPLYGCCPLYSPHLQMYYQLENEWLRQKSQTEFGQDPPPIAQKNRSFFSVTSSLRAIMARLYDESYDNDRHKVDLPHHRYRHPHQVYSWR